MKYHTSIIKNSQHLPTFSVCLQKHSAEMSKFWYHHMTSQGRPGFAAGEQRGSKLVDFRPKASKRNVLKHIRGSD